MAETITKAHSVEEFLRDADLPRLSIAIDGQNFTASSYWPNGHILHDRHCFGKAETIDEAISQVRAEIEKAKVEAKTLRTAAECKRAVVALIEEHDASPEAFRLAVDKLKVSDSRI